MSLVTLDRTISDADGTFGALVAPGLRGLVTVEDDWLDNAPGRSCIPAGSYTLKRTIFHRHGYETFEVMHVPNRSRILVHPANTEEDVEGCIGVGLSLGRIKVPRDEDTGLRNVDKRAAIASKEAFRHFMAALYGIDEIPFLVTWAPGLPRAAV